MSHRTMQAQFDPNGAPAPTLLANPATRSAYEAAGGWRDQLTPPQQQQAAGNAPGQQG